MSIVLQVNTTKGLVNVLLNAEKQYSTRCRILGIRAKCYGFGGAFTPKFISPQAIETAHSLGYDLATEEGMQAVLRDKEKISTVFDPLGKLPKTKPISYYFTEKRVHKKWWFWPGVAAYTLIMVLALRACVGPSSDVGDVIYANGVVNSSYTMKVGDWLGDITERITKMIYNLARKYPDARRIEIELKMNAEGGEDTYGNKQTGIYAFDKVIVENLGEVRKYASYEKYYNQTYYWLPYQIKYKVGHLLKGTEMFNLK